MSAAAAGRTMTCFTDPGANSIKNLVPRTPEASELLD